MLAAASMRERASRSLPFSQARGRYTWISLIPSSAMPSASGWNPGEQNASKQCTKASIPVAAVIAGGRPTVSSGSLIDRKSTRLNSSHSQISYAVFCLKKKKNIYRSIHVHSSLHCRTDHDAFPVLTFCRGLSRPHTHLDRRLSLDATRVFSNLTLSSRH